MIYCVSQHLKLKMVIKYPSKLSGKVLLLKILGDTALNLIIRKSQMGKTEEDIGVNGYTS